MRIMTVTEGLAELKLLDSRINKAIDKEFTWSAKNVDMTEEAKARHKETAEANYASVTDLIKNRNAIKSAIVKSNAVTMVNVNGVEMTVAEAIERKTSIDYEKHFLNELKKQYTGAKLNAERMNERVQERIDNMLSQIASSGKSDIADAQRVMSETYMANNGWGVFDPLDLAEKIKVMDEQIDGFEKDVDIALSVSNAVTRIEI